jgi:hypothetical protein
VSVVVSSGGRPEVIELRSVVGQSEDAAVAALSEFRVEREAVPSTAPAGRVLSQEPAAGSALAPGSTVRLRVSDGSRVVAPALAALTLGEAREAARTAGLAVATDTAEVAGSARVTAQQPPPGTEMARGSALRLVVEESSLPFGVQDAARASVERAAEFARRQSARDLAIGVVALLALLALLLLGFRRSRHPHRAREPVWTPDTTLGREPRAPSSLRRETVDRTLELPERAPSAEAARPVPTPVVAPPESAAPTPIPRSTVEAARAPAGPSALLRAPARGAERAPEPIRREAVTRESTSPEPTTLKPTMTKPTTLERTALESNAVESVAPEPTAPLFTPPPPLFPSLFRRRKAPAVPPAVAAPPAPERVEIRATARLDADPARTVAPNAAPRGPEIRIAARLDAGAADVRELPAEPAPDELTEESK